MLAKSRILSTAVVVASVLLLCLPAGQIQAAPVGAPASQTGTSTLPLVAIHVSELTQALETMPASGSYTHRIRYHWIPVVACIVALLCDV